MKVLHKIKYTAKANRFKGYAIHSPFIYGVVSDLIYAKYPFYSFSKLREFYKTLPRKERNLALSLKNAYRLYRLLNVLQPSIVTAITPDRFDAFILQSYRMAKHGEKIDRQERSLYYLAGEEDKEWHLALRHIPNQGRAIWVVKHPTTQNKVSWNNLLHSGFTTSTITFYGLGIAFTDKVLPVKNFRIV